MYVCICKGITEEDLKRVHTSVQGNKSEVLKNLGVGDSCGICLIDAIDKLNSLATPASNEA
jgi:bacterioferritin-associated ferredoxin